MVSSTGTSSASLTDSIRKLIADELGFAVEDVELEDCLRDDLGADSMDLISLQSALEDLCCIQIEDRELQQVRTVKEVIDLAWGKLPSVTVLK